MESIYWQISELLTTSNEFNTSLELMGESAFIGEAAAKVVEDHMVKPEDIHNKYKTEVEALITALEREVSITREDKVVARADSRGSSRNKLLTKLILGSFRFPVKEKIVTSSES